MVNVVKEQPSDVICWLASRSYTTYYYILSTSECLCVDTQCIDKKSLTQKKGDWPHSSQEPFVGSLQSEVEQPILEGLAPLSFKLSSLLEKKGHILGKILINIIPCDKIGQRIERGPPIQKDYTVVDFLAVTPQIILI